MKNCLDAAREEGLEEGREEGVNAQKASLNSILRARFGQVAPLTQSAIESINNLDSLKNLVIKAALAESGEAFEEYLKALVKSSAPRRPAQKVSEPAAVYASSRKPRTRKRP